MLSGAIADKWVVNFFVVGIRKQAINRLNLQQTMYDADFIACELWVKRVETFEVVLYRNQDFSVC